MIKFSIIVPVYNVKPYLRQCIESVLQQTYRNFELIMVDDGSTDGSGEICDEYAKEETRICVIHQENGGLSRARNTGMKLANGDFIVFLDSDDYWQRTDALSMMHEEINGYHPDVLLIKSQKYFLDTGVLESNYNMSSSIDLEGKNYEEQLKWCVESQLFDTCAWNKVFSTRMIKNDELFFTEGIIAEDIDWVARLSLFATRLAILKKPIHIYRKGRNGAITNSLKYKNLRDTKESIERCIAYVKDKELSDCMKDAYYGYVAYRYVIWLAEYEAVSDERKKELLSEMMALKWLLKYSVNKKVQIVRIAESILGIRITMKLLKWYLKRKC